MESTKVKKFMQLAGQRLCQEPEQADSKLKELGAQLLLSETLEYVIKGLGVKLSFEGKDITDPNGLDYTANSSSTDKTEMLDGLADVAYTMYWNMLAFGLKLEEGFDMVCDNNLDKFVLLPDWQDGEGIVSEEDWHLERSISWPPEVDQVEIIQVGSEYYAVGKDINGKVRKPSSYASVDLSPLV